MLPRVRQPYQYGVIAQGAIARYPSKAIAVEAARSWVTSPLRSGPRSASVMRRRGWDGVWEVVDTWSIDFATVRHERGA